MRTEQAARDGTNQQRDHEPGIDVSQPEVKQSRDSRENDSVHDVGTDVHLWGITVEQQQQHHDDAARPDGGHAHKETGNQADHRHARETLRGRRAIDDPIFDFFLEQHQGGNHDEQYTHRSLDKAVNAIPVDVANVHQQLHSTDRAGNAADRKRNHDLAADGAFLKVQQASRDFREEVEERVGADGHDGLYLQAKNQNREQQNAAPHPAHADEDAHNKANQNFGRYQWHSGALFALLSRPVHANEAFALQVQNDFLGGFLG